MLFLSRIKRLHNFRCVLVSFLVVFSIADGIAQNQRKDYAGVALMLREFIEHEMADKQLPAISIALVDDQEIVWSDGFGFADPVKKIPATAETIYRVGSVSKLLTDIGMMQLVERGEVELDAPIQKYLPDFHPKNPFHKPITLRQIMSHRAGLVRESPVGHYFDPTEPSLAKTVLSLNQTELVYEPEKRTKYSNAGIATAGYVLERLKGKPFEHYIEEAVLKPLGMEFSSYERKKEFEPYIAKSYMWTYDGRVFPAPTFQLGTGPARNLFSTVRDLGKLLSMMFNGGEGTNGRLLKTTTLAQMWVPQFAPANHRAGYGIGFAISDFDGYLRVGHGGAVYGYAAELTALPEEKIGVVLCTTMDSANDVLARIAKYALHLMLAYRADEPRPSIAIAEPIPPQQAKELAGLYAKGNKKIRLHERHGKLFAERGVSVSLALKYFGKDLITEDRLNVGTSLALLDGGRLVDGNDTLVRTSEQKPQLVPPRWKGLIGEYGWDHDILYILEKDGKLHALIEWYDDYPLTEISNDVYAFPDYGLYHGEKLTFVRDKRGRATQALVGPVLFTRRTIDGEDGATATIIPLKPATELRETALAAKPPEEKGNFLKPDLIEITSLDSTIKLDLRYASKNNFMNTVFYSSAKAFMQRPAAEALVRVHQKLKKQGYGLLIHDSYRPWYVTKMFWDATPDDKKIFVADPVKGSRHNRGCAVDVTLYDLTTGKPLEMVSGYDEFSDRAFPEYPGGSSLQRYYRTVLRKAMEEQNFTVYEWEWWHFDYNDWKRYPIGTLTFEELLKAKK